MKKVKSYNLSEENFKKIEAKAKADGRKNSDWLDRFLTESLDDASFSLNPLNIEYIESAVLAQKEVNSRYSRSMYMDDLITHLRTKAKPKKTQSVNLANPEKPSRFKPPTVKEVFDYCNERCNNVDAQNFVDHYSVNNWMRGKNKIKDWKACVRTWEKNSTSSSNQLSKTTEQNIKNLEGEW